MATSGLTKPERETLSSLRDDLEEDPFTSQGTLAVALGNMPELEVLPERLLDAQAGWWVLVASFNSWASAGAREWAALSMQRTNRGVVVTLLGNDKTFNASLRRAAEYVALVGDEVSRRKALRIIRKELS